MIVDPTEAQLADVAAMTGVSVSSSAKAVAVEPSSSGGYRLRVVPARAPAVAEILSEASSEPTATEPIAAEVSAAEAIAELSKPAQRAGDDGSLLGPPGSLSGSRAIELASWGSPAMSRGEFKPHVIAEDQPFMSSCENTFYVYWVDGSELPPHYLVLLRQHAAFSVSHLARGMVHDADNIRGFGMFSASTELSEVSAFVGGSDVPVHLVRTSPATGEPGAHVRVEVRMTQDVTGGTAIARATMQERFPLSLDGWTVHNRSSGYFPRWLFAQDHTIAGGLSGPRLVNVHFNGHDVRPFPAITTSGLAARTYALWRVRGGRDASRDVKLHVTFEMQQHFMMLANGSARIRNDRGGAQVLERTEPLRFTLDLRQITEQR